MLFKTKTGEMSDFEKLMFTEDYIVLLKKALREKEANEIIYKRNLEEIPEVFKLANSKFRKLSSYLREMNAHRVKTKTAERKAEKFEGKNYLLREKVRGLQAIIAKEEEIRKGLS